MLEGGYPVPAGTGDLLIYRVVHANFPKFFLKFFIRNFPAPDAVCSEGLPARCARSLRLCRFGRTCLIVYVGLRGHGCVVFFSGNVDGCGYAQCFLHIRGRSPWVKTGGRHNLEMLVEGSESVLLQIL